MNHRVKLSRLRKTVWSQSREIFDFWTPLIFETNEVMTYL